MSYACMLRSPIEFNENYFQVSVYKIPSILCLFHILKGFEKLSVDVSVATVFVQKPKPTLLY